LAKLKLNYRLTEHNCLRLPATCGAYCCVNTESDIQQALDYARDHAFDVLALGDGSNVVLGELSQTLVLDINLHGVEIVSETEHAVVLKIMAGESWHGLVEYCVRHQYYGLENLALIPGRVGAAPVQNIGAYGVEVGDFITQIDGFALGNDARNAKLTSLTADQCQFAYRDSIFKRALRDNFIITAVYLELHKQFTPQLEYQALRSYLSKNVAHNSIIDAEAVKNAVIAIRQQKLPDPQVIPNVGRFFKNPVVDEQTFQHLFAHNPNLAYTQLTVNNENIKQYKLAAGWLIEQAGLKGIEYDGLAMYERQALVLARVGQVSEHSDIAAQDVMRFARRVQRSVKQRFSVLLEIEPRCYPASLLSC
jgi:UDP-N-acetylmuramate dehydrogenase